MLLKKSLPSYRPFFFSLKKKRKRVGVNKSSGLSWLANHLGFTMDECVAFGDSSNDFEMLRDAGLGVCMDNGTGHSL